MDRDVQMYRLACSGQRVYLTTDGRWRDLDSGFPLVIAPTAEQLAAATPLRIERADL